ncbi:hypothetical protein LPTSP4_34840 [Leptospira ryugenii]|uniref:SGNH/GDSL hydrolase family protein n=1 Tax=Leptospira ryugenii TaxID=1917863 RepID=A0A2P2E503_9LEPT|nr:hypothetical protein [Leptospira ryugenii]GBF51946.1 hypothetical protein LPTSP4_34840 [Leptospira ryugenii]
MKSKDFLKFLTDKPIVIAFSTILIIEILLQIGVYKPFLKKNSYAANINRVTNHIIEQRKVLDPTILIVGTSVAFEGISVRILNEELKSTGEEVQSFAIRGSELVVQHHLLSEHLRKFPKVHTIIHVLEPGMAWVDRSHLVEPTMVMLSEVGNVSSIPLVQKYEYKMVWTDYLFLLFKSIAYRKDLGDMFINFNERIKAIARRNKNPNLMPWDYENPHTESMGPYNIRSLEECMEKTNPQTTFPLPTESDIDHRRMIHETCAIAITVPKDPIKTESTDRYFRRLNKMYSLILDQKIHIINVFAPYSSAIRPLNGPERMKIWEDGLHFALGDRQSLDQYDLQDSLGKEENGQYCFDLIHLNRQGMETFSHILGKELAKRYKK